jgi:hypothetical protein
VTVNPTPSYQGTVEAGTSNKTFSPTSGNHFSSVIVKPTPTETKTVSVQTSDKTYSPSSGKHFSSFTVQGHTCTLASAGYSTQTKSVTAGTSSKDVTPDSGKLLSKVTVAPTPSQTKTVTAGTSNTDVTPDSGKLLSKVTVKPTPSETSSFTPTKAGKTIKPSSGKLLSSVTVAGDDDLIASNIKEGVQIFGVTGTYRGGQVDVSKLKTTEPVILRDSSENETFTISYQVPKAGNLYFAVKCEDDCNGITDATAWCWLSGGPTFGKQVNKDQIVTWTFTRDDNGKDGHSSLDPEAIVTAFVLYE